MLIKKGDSVRHQNSAGCTVWEYNYKDPDSSFAIGEINGRYPEVGFSVNAVNEECVEMFYILSGTLTVHTDDQIFVAEVGDFARIEKDHTYFLEGDNARFCIFNTPRWTIDQHMNISLPI